MAYTQYDIDKPDGTETGPQVVTSMRENMQALTDAIVSGMFYGWDFSQAAGTGTEEQPQYVYYKNGTDWLRGEYTWGTSGGGDGAVTQAVWSRSYDSGSNYDTIGTVTYTFSSAGKVTATTYS